MDGWRIGRPVILAGGLGIFLGAALAAAADDSRRNLLERGSTGPLALSLLLLGLAAWHFRAWGLGKLVAVGLLAAGLCSSPSSTLVTETCSGSRGSRGSNSSPAG